MDSSVLNDYCGLDLGDGETAVAWLKQGSAMPPAILEVRGTKNVLTALGADDKGQYFIGEEAYQISDLTQLHLRFKSKFLTHQEPASGCIEIFARTLLQHLLAEKRISNASSTKFFVGCPSGWNPQDREKYALLFEKAGFRNIKMISESRAAFLYSRESGQLHLSDDALDTPTLIIDAGSSTTDYTLVSKMVEKRLEDRGEVKLGAGLIDQMLWLRNLKMQPNAEKLAPLLRQYPQWNTRCEMEARRVKERYFNAQNNGFAHMANIESSVRLYCTSPATHVDIVCNDELMKNILQTPLPELYGLSYLEAYKKSLLNIRQAIKGQQPHIVLMTGGASRMRFMREIASEVFPDAQLVFGNEPEFAIARGLCYALRMEEGVTGFQQAVDDLVSSQTVETLVGKALKPLFQSISEPVVAGIIEQVAKPALQRWKAGEIPTLNGISDEMIKQSEIYLHSDEVRTLLQPYVKQWLDDLRIQLEAHTNPICDRFQLPRTSLRLPDFGVSPGNVDISTYAAVDFSQIKLVLDVIIASIIAVMAGGAGTALLASGPVGLVLGFVLGLAVAFLGVQMAEKLVMDADIPLVIRKMMPVKMFYKKLEGKKTELAKKTYDRLVEDVDHQSAATMEMKKNTAHSIEHQLLHEMDKAILLIR